MEPELRPLRASEGEAAFALDADAFHQGPERRAGFLGGFEPERWVGAFEAGRLVAQAMAHGFGQFFGGRSVPMGGLASVAVAADRRGRGLAGRVCAAALQAMRERGEVLSTLFPASTSLYRKLGYELAGHVVYRKLRPAALRGLPAPARCETRAAAPADLARLRACYARLAPQVNGFVDRPEALWERRAAEATGRTTVLAEDAAGEVQGYVVYRQRDGEASDLGGPFELAVEDHAAAGLDGALAIWRLLGSWSSQVEWIHYRGAAEDPLLLLLPEQALELEGEIRWMTRLVDAAGAVAARGYPPGLAVEAHLALRDPLLPDNDGRFVLGVREGEGRLEPGGRGRLELDVGALGAIYTGWAAPATLARAGRLAGGAPADLAALGAAFAGPTPWMLDAF